MDNYKDIELSAPNIVMRLPEDWDDTRPTEYMYPVFKEFIEAAAKEFPYWTFVQGSSYALQQTVMREGVEVSIYRLRDFDIYYKRERLGGVQATFNRGAPCIRLSNQRIYQDAERGSCKETKDVKKALKLLKKYFGEKSISELMEEAVNECNSAAASVFNSKRRLLHQNYGHITSYLMDYVVDNLDTLGQEAIKAGADPVIVRELPDQQEQTQIVEGIYSCYGNKKGVVVLLHGRNYAVHKRGDEYPRIYTVDDVPAILKRKLGLLKLVEDGQCITDVGMRVKEDKYLVMEESL